VRRGDIFWVNLDPVVGSEVGKKRPAVVVQNEAANATSATVTVIPLSTSAGRVYPFQVQIPAGEAGLERASKALCEQIRTLSRNRVLERIGTLGQPRLDELRRAVDRHLWL
jgi:mRNA interferase MazF